MLLIIKGEELFETLKDPVQTPNNSYKKYRTLYAQHRICIQNFEELYKLLYFEKRIEPTSETFLQKAAPIRGCHHMGSTRYG
jgi:hypothetical protein